MRPGGGETTEGRVVMGKDQGRVGCSCTEVLAREVKEAAPQGAPEPIPRTAAARGHDETPNNYPLSPQNWPCFALHFPQLNLDPTVEDHLAPSFHTKQAVYCGRSRKTPWEEQGNNYIQCHKRTLETQSPEDRNNTDTSTNPAPTLKHSRAVLLNAFCSTSWIQKSYPETIQTPGTSLQCHLAAR